MGKNITDYINYVTYIKSDKYYGIHKWLFYITPDRGPHLDFYNNPIGFDGSTLEKKITKLRAKFIKGIIYLTDCDKSNVYINQHTVNEIVKQLEKCILNKDYWIRYGFNSKQSERITSIYHMLIAFFNDYLQEKRKKTPVVGIGSTSEGDNLYKFLIKMNNSIDIDPVQLQLFATRNLNRHIAELINYSKDTGRDTIESIMNIERSSGKHFESEKELLIESKKILIDLHKKTEKLFSKKIKIPNITKLTVKVVPSIDSKWSSKSKFDKNTIYIDTTRYKNYIKSELYGILAHEGLPGHLLEKINEKIVIDDLSIDSDLRPICFRGIKMMHDGWAIYSNKLVNTDVKSIIMNSILYDLRAIIDIGLNCSEGRVLTLDEARYLLKNYTQLSDARIDDELRGYLASPGEATSYIIGELFFNEIRRIATTNSVDIKQLNTMLLTNISTASELLERVKNLK
jgi:uncharacterized protein (DUF885 family)